MTTKAKKITTPKPKAEEAVVEKKALEQIEESVEKKEGTVSIPLGKYEQMLEALTAFMSQQSTAGSTGENDKIQRDEYIEVISLTPRLVTVTAGSGRQYNFKGFGVSIEIPYEDLSSIVQNSFSFFEKGYIYVNDARFTKANGLEHIAKRVLTKEQIEAIVYGDSPEAMSLFKNGTVAQKEIMASMLMSEIIDGKAVDMNKVKKISEFVGFDLSQRAQEFKELMDSLGKNIE